MNEEAELAVVRRAYAKQVLAVVGIGDPRLEAAFAAVPRERFLGPGPWPMVRLPGTYVPTPAADPVYVYTDQVFGILPERNINNGQPSLHAMLLAAAGIVAGEHVVHVGAGTGYYTAIMAELAGPAGRVTAIESDPALAARARDYLGRTARVTVLEADGTITRVDDADVIYVNAGVTRPAEVWLDALRDGGRLIVPLTTDANFRAASSASFDPMRTMRSGGFFRIERRGAAFAARWLCPTAIVPADGGRDAASEAALAAAFENGGWHEVTSLVRGEVLPERPYWLRGDGWGLASG